MSGPCSLTRCSALVASLLVTLGLAGCHALGSLSTSASMLVEVEVYKGPLNSGKPVQLGELVAVFDSAEVLLQRFEDGAMKIGGCGAQTTEHSSPELCAARTRSQEIRTQMMGFPAEPPGPNVPADRNHAAARTAALKELHAKATGMQDLSASKTDKLAVFDTISQAARIATQLKVEAFYWAESQIGGVVQDQRQRSLLVGYINLVSELGNQIASRNDVLAKQLTNGQRGAQLALSDLLKDTGPTDFLHLYDWYQATMPDALSTGPEALTPQDRGRLARRLFADHYWTRTNQVHASGQGEVRMALVKDDIGNWSLKSFDADPGKLLDAYRQLTLAGIEAGIRAGRALASGGTSAGLDQASQFARGRLGAGEVPAASAQRLEVLRGRLVAELEGLSRDAQQQDGPMAQDEQRERAAYEVRQKAVIAKTAEYRKAQEDALAAEQALQQARLRDRPVAEQEALEKRYDSTAAAEEARRLELAKLQAEETASKANLDIASGKRSTWWTTLITEAQQALNVHRRVVDALKEMQSPPLPGQR